MNIERAKILQDIKYNDTNYDIRYNLIIKAMTLAAECGYNIGFRVDESGWPIVIIHLDEGQISWHMPPDNTNYDGHDTDEKYKRIDLFCNKYL